MPIKPENQHRYPANWPAIRARIRTRANDACEVCGVRNHALGWRDADGTFNEVSAKEVTNSVESSRIWLGGSLYLGIYKIIRIVCTVAHLDHVPERCDDTNLKFMCQRCHLKHDVAHHLMTAYATRRAGKAVDMFEVGP